MVAIIIVMKDPFQDWWDETHNEEELLDDDANELDIAFEDDEDLI